MKAINLFSGKKSVANVLTAEGWEVVTVDIDPTLEPDICIDINDLTAAQLPDVDFIWASPPCECFSVASIGTHWYKDRTPKTEKAQAALLLLLHALYIIKEKDPRWWTLENPRGMMRNVMPENLVRYTVTYCQYGDKRMKPTDLWGSFPDGWMPMKCNANALCHEAAPRGSKTGTQGLKTYHDRSAIPRDLILSLISKMK